MKKRILIIKTTSLGDVLHTLPAVSELLLYSSNITIDWVVEDSFSEIVEWHPGINRIWKVSIRKWRRNLFSLNTWKQILNFVRSIRSEKYDLVIDAQGLFKSALILLLIRSNKKYGLDYASAREGWVSIFYKNKIEVKKGEHAIFRTKSLFGKAFGYEPDYSNFSSNIEHNWVNNDSHDNTIVFLHGTTWKTKHWPDQYWRELAILLVKRGYKIYLPWGSDLEKSRAIKISDGEENIKVLDKLTLSQLAFILTNSALVVSVDTGLSHLTAACNTPIISIYGPTSSQLTGSMGMKSHFFSSDLSCAPCFKKKCIISDSQFPPCLNHIKPREIYDKCIGMLL